MLAELLLVIAQLCMIPSGSGGVKYLEKHQLECQRWYLRCITTNEYTTQVTIDANKLSTCINLRKPE